MDKEYVASPYFRVGRATDLKGKDYMLYRLLEIFPGFLSWGTIVGVILASAYAPTYAAYFIIAFDVYWVLKTAYLSAHLRQNWRRMKYNTNVDWEERLKNFKYDHITHLVLLPYYKESKETVEAGLLSLLEAKRGKSKMAVVLAAEERAGEEAWKIGEEMREKYKDKFNHFIVTVHPKDTPGEMPGKGSNISYAAEEARKQILDPHGVSYENVLVSAFDIDTVVYPQYFLCLTWNFLTAEDPYRVSFQPVPVYNNNIWNAPALSRVVATSGTFWQMIQQERPERLATFSSHSVCFKQLHEIGYWQKNMVNEDSRIFWNLYVAYDTQYRVVPIAYPVSMDANIAPTSWGTIKNIYKQQQRWTYGVENLPYVFLSFLRKRKGRIPIKEKIRMTLIKIESFWSLATNPIIIFLLGWLPIVLGGRAFNETLLSYNLPLITRNLMILAMLGLIVSAIISMSFLPPRPDSKKKSKFVGMVLQWVLVPLTITVFGAVPGLDSQTRLIFKKYLGFWVTPKHRQGKRNMEKKSEKGHIHPITHAINDVVSIFDELGFSVIQGPEIETEENNFDLLNIPKNHPARDLWDTFWLKDGRLLRTHTSPVQARYMKSHKPPVRIISPGKVFRYEATDKTHEAQFYQVEGLLVDEKTTLADLKAILELFFKKYLGENTKIRFRPSYFPFVEPGVEVDIYFKDKWLEVMGAGMVHPKVLSNLGVHPRKYQGFAFGGGIDRLAMLKYDIPDIRMFYNGDLRVVNQF